MTEKKSAVVHIHIPKTAGSNFRRQMALALSKTGRGRQIVGVDGIVGLDKNLDNTVHNLAETAFKSLDGRFLQFLTGHFRYRNVSDLIQQNRRLYIVTAIVRDPVRRLISDYAYSTSPAHTDQQNFVARYPTFESYINARGTLGKQLDFLKPFKDAGVSETLDHLANHFDFVAVTERFDADFATFAQRLGLDVPTPTRKNKGLNKDLARALWESHGDNLKELLTEEYQLYDAICEMEWGSEPFDIVKPMEVDVQTRPEDVPETEADKALKQKLEALGPWHHHISLSPAVATTAGTQDQRPGTISVTDPAEIFRANALPFLPDGMAGKSFLDCGCNAGGYCFAAKAAGAERTYGFDVRQHWIDQARFIADHRADSEGMRFEVADLQDLTNHDETFDVTWFSGLLYHLPDPVHSLKLVADRTNDLLFINTAVLPLEEGETEQLSFVMKHESTEHPMSGVHEMSWLPGGPTVLRHLLVWLGFPEMHLQFWRKKQPNQNRPGRLGLVAARETGRLARHLKNGVRHTM